MRTSRTLVAAASLVVALAVAATAAAAKPKAAPYAPKIDPANFQSTIDNPYFPLVPGTVYRYTEKAGGKVSETVSTVTSDTKMILGVPCVVVHEVVSEKGKVKEDTYDWYAQDKQGNVWYFGEDTKEYKPYGRVSTEGSWESGVNGAQPGIMMYAAPAIGEPFREEYLRGVAEDMGQIVALDATVKVPYGEFTGCVQTKEWSMLEPGSEKKWYAKGVGFIRAESTSKEVTELVSVTRP